MAVIQGAWRVGSAATLGGGTDQDRRLVLSAMPSGETYIVAKVFADDEGDFESTARLLAAAPELLAVCSAIAHDLSLFQFTDGEYRLSEQSAGVILRSLREVIAKAEGTDGENRRVD